MNLVDCSWELLIDMDSSGMAGRCNKSNPKAKAKKTTAASSPLKKHFGRLTTKTCVEASTSSSNNKEADPPRKVLTATFLTYIQSALKGRNPECVQQAQAIHEAYGLLSAENKKAMVTEFFRSGGKKAGLSCLYEQHISVHQQCEDQGWAGYITCGLLMDMWKVSPSIHVVPYPHN